MNGNALNLTRGGVGVTSQESEVGRELSFLRDKCAGLESATQILKERLAMVTRQHPTAACENSKEDLHPTLSNLGCQLRARSADITSCTMQLRELIELLAI